MISANIFIIDYAQISKAIQSFTTTQQYGNGPNFIVMSLETLERLKWDNIYLSVSPINPSKTLDFSHEIMGVPIAINNSLKLGEIRVV